MAYDSGDDACALLVLFADLACMVLCHQNGARRLVQRMNAAIRLYSRRRGEEGEEEKVSPLPETGLLQGGKLIRNKVQRPREGAWAVILFCPSESTDQAAYHNNYCSARLAPLLDATHVCFSAGNMCASFLLLLLLLRLSSFSSLSSSSSPSLPSLLTTLSLSLSRHPSWPLSSPPSLPSTAMSSSTPLGKTASSCFPPL